MKKEIAEIIGLIKEDCCNCPGGIIKECKKCDLKDADKILNLILQNIQIEVKCPQCEGLGWIAEHDPMSCNCGTIGNTCPVQVQCQCIDGKITRPATPEDLKKSVILKDA